MTLRKTMLVSAAYAIPLILSIFVLAPAFAAERSPLPRVEVHYGDLDLSRTPGAEALVGRLRQAAKQVCDEEHFLSALDARTKYKICVETSFERAVADLGEPMVTDIYQRRFGTKVDVATK
jgi:UrcA family protein